MKLFRSSPSRSLFFFIVFSFLLLSHLLFFPLLAKAEGLVIGLETATIKLKPSYLSKNVGTVKYGDSVVISEKNGAWRKVKFNGVQGWLHVSAFSKGDSVLHDIGRGQQASSGVYKDEAVTAGKGFSPEYEAMYKKENPNVSFAPIDILEKRTVAPDSLIDFAKKGDLKSQLLASEVSK